MIRSRLACAFLLVAAFAATAEPRWSVEKANAWAAANPWWCGVNYIPANAVNYTAMWDKTSFSPDVIRRELKLMTDLGMNCVRFVMQYKVYEDDPAYFLKTLDEFLAICDEAKLKAMPIFFDDCVFGANADPVIGRQPEPLEGWYAWAWSPSPGHTMVIDEREHPKLERYVKDVMTRHRDDQRIFLWDLYNEPCSGRLGKRAMPLLRRTFAWAREVDPAQPISSGVWNGDKELTAFLLANSDVVTFHCYADAEKTAKKIKEMLSGGRPVICTEWMNRTCKSTVADCLGLFADANVGCVLWGLVNGKTQTHLKWGHRPEMLPYKGPWQHDLFHGDFTPYDKAEVDLIKTTCGSKNAKFLGAKREQGQTSFAWSMEVELEGEEKPLMVESVAQECRAEGGRFVYGPLKCGGAVLDAKVVVDVRETPSGRVYSGVVENNDSRARVTMFNGPTLGAVAIDPEKAHIYLPSGFGRRLNHFPLETKGHGRWEVRKDGTMYLESSPYPSRFLTMPWIAVDTGAGTWYAAVHDAKERIKRIGVKWHYRAKEADVRFRHPVSVRAGGRWDIPETAFEKMRGDWHGAAKRYRAWFDSAHPAVRSSVPDWTRDLTGWLLVIMKQQNEELMWPYTDIPRICDVAERSGLNSIGLFGWTVGGHDHLYPDYDADPKMGGAEALKAGIAEAHRRGIRVCIYANGQLQQIGATKFWGEHGERIAVLKRDGTPYIQTYHKYKDIPIYQFAIGCLYGEAWHDRMLSLARQARGFGADAILYDQLGVTTPFECWGDGHGHPVPWHSHCEERPGFVRRIVGEMHAEDGEFAVFTEGLHDALLDTIGMFHACQPSAFMGDVNALRSARTSAHAKSEPFPELFLYTFPELVTTTRNPTPMARRSFVNYAAVFGLRHEIEMRYMPDRTYALDGKVPTKKDYGEVKNLPSLADMRAEPPDAASAYMKAVCDFQRKHAKYLMRGRFVDDEGFSATDGVVAKRFVADDGTSAVCVWNVGESPLDVAIDGLGRPKGVFAPGGESPDGELKANSLRLYVF